MKQSLEQLDNTLQLYFVQKAPALPENWKEVLVKFLPWIVLILLVLALPAVLVFLGLSTVLLPVSFLGGVGTGIGYVLAMVVLIGTLVLEGMAIPGLFKRTRSAWRLLYYSALLSILYNLLTLNLVGFIVGGLLSLYLLFQIKSHYH
jgi:hypothetical protein